MPWSVNQVEPSKSPAVVFTKEAPPLAPLGVTSAPTQDSCSGDGGGHTDRESCYSPTETRTRILVDGRAR